MSDTDTTTQRGWPRAPETCVSIRADLLCWHMECLFDIVERVTEHNRRREEIERWDMVRRWKIGVGPKAGDMSAHQRIAMATVADVRHGRRARATKKHRQLYYREETARRVGLR
jgi:hypothetical protein